MKRTTKTLVVGISAVSFLLLNVPTSMGQTNEELKAMQDLLQTQGQQIQQLLKERAEDRERIQHLEQLVNENGQKAARSEQAATNAQQKAEESQKATAEIATQVQTMKTSPSEESAARSNFQLVGYAHADYQKTKGENGSFLLGSFNPIFLYRAGDKTLFESELEIEVANGDGGGTETEVGLEYAQVDYAFNDYVTGIAGKMLLPLGTFIEKTHPAWINKLPNFPLPREDETAILPESGVGVEARGAFHVYNDQVMTYSLYGVNGPGSDDGSGAADQLDLQGNVMDFNGVPSAGGRIAWFYPWKPYSDVEIGVSGQSGTWDDSNSYLWSAFVVDATLHLGPNFEARGEYINTWQQTSDQGTVHPSGWWAQASYKLAGLNLDLPLINNFETVFRYSTVDPDQPDTELKAYTLGLVYYFSSQLEAKAAYEFRCGDNPDEARNQMMFQVAYGF